MLPAHAHFHTCESIGKANRANVFCFMSSFFTPSSPSHRGTVWVLPAYISLLINNTVSRVQGCLIIRCEMFCGTPKEDDRWPLSIQSSLGTASGYRAKPFFSVGFNPLPFF
jgi:hypothetical protein